MNPTSKSCLREQFLLDPNVIYFNHGSFGATPRPVFESYQRWQCELERQPVKYFQRSNEYMLASRQALAAYLGTSTENLAFVANATTGLNAIVRSLKLAPGDEILSTNHEYGALDRTWQYAAQKRDLKYINHPIGLPVQTDESFVDALWQGVTERTRVIFLSHITSPTALIFPVEAVCRRARREGILTVVDGAHAPGQIPLCLDELGADFYAGNLHKWMCAPKGSAFVYVRPEHHHKIEPLVVSWSWQSSPENPIPYADLIEHQGTRDLAAFLAVADAIAFLQQNDWDQVRRDCHTLAVEIVQKIQQITGLPPFSPLTSQWFSQMVSAPLPLGLDLPRLYQRLYQEYHIEVPVFAWNGIPLIRLSIQAYNSPRDAELLLQALACAAG